MRYSCRRFRNQCVPAPILIPISLYSLLVYVVYPVLQYPYFTWLKGPFCLQMPVERIYWLPRSYYHNCFPLVVLSVVSAPQSCYPKEHSFWYGSYSIPQMNKTYWSGCSEMSGQVRLLNHSSRLWSTFSVTHRPQSMALRLKPPSSCRRRHHHRRHIPSATVHSATIAVALMSLMKTNRR